MGDLTVEATVSEQDIRDAGWHHDDECDHDFCQPADDVDVGRIVDALEEMHRELHPHDPWDVRRCKSDPCSTLTFPVLARA